MLELRRSITIILVAINASIVLSIVTIQDGHSKGRG